MIKGLTLKEFFKDYVVQSTYTDLHQLMVTDGLIFKVVRDKLENTDYTVNSTGTFTFANGLNNGDVIQIIAMN